VDFIVTPDPGPREREAVAAALERLLVAGELPAAYRSGWRQAGVLENLDGEEPASATSPSAC
jgi:hypothetical protein